MLAASDDNQNSKASGQQLNFELKLKRSSIKPRRAVDLGNNALSL